METFVRTYLEEPSAARLRLPPKAADCHVHIFGPVARFAYAAERRQTPLEAPKEKLFALHRKLGIERCVIVQSVIHGMDNAVVEDAIQASAGRYLGIALVPVDVADAELQRLARAGFRGVRFNFMQHLGNGASVEQVLALTQRLKAVGMHVQVHFESALVHTVGRALQASAVPVVIDHMGRVDATRGAVHADFQALMDVLQAPHMHVKVSGIDRINADLRAGSGYPQGVELARLLVQHYPAQCVWGLDWPHPNHTHIPDDGELLNALAQIAPTPAELQQLLVDNPERLYRFDAAIKGFL
jgi:2-pyrone-4,6-dicarboxylate lactonase